MKCNINVFVKLRVPDLWAITAKKTITKLLGYDCLADITREDVWHLCIEGESKEEIKKYAQDIAKNSNLFVNPNKHTYRMEIGDKLLLNTKYQAPSTFTVPVVIYCFDNTVSVLTYETLRYRLQYKNVRHVSGGTLWWLEVCSESKESARKIAKKIIVCKTRKGGLLSNPHISYYRIF